MFQHFKYLAETPPKSCSPENRRTYPRVETCLTAHWQGTTSGCSVRIADVSEGGCYVDSIAKVLVGETLTLNIFSNNDQSFEVSCVVAHHSRMGFGVRFLDLDDKQRDQVRVLIEKP